MSEKKIRKPLTEEQKAAQRARKRAWNQANREKVAAYNRAWMEANPDRAKASRKAYYEANKDAAVARASEWQKANPEKTKGYQKARYDRGKGDLSAYYRKRYLENKDAINARAKVWRSKNPDAVRIFLANRRARVLRQTGVVSRDIANRLMILQKGRCGACRNSLSATGYHLDHIHPISKGGAHADSNMQLLCPTCNHEKHAKHPVDFMQSKGFLL
jgi:5-methylcytosine-specific restriction endonuclease McrA